MKKTFKVTLRFAYGLVTVISRSCMSPTFRCTYTLVWLYGTTITAVCHLFLWCTRTSACGFGDRRCCMSPILWCTYTSFLITYCISGNRHLPSEKILSLRVYSHPVKPLCILAGLGPPTAALTQTSLGNTIMLFASSLLRFLHLTIVFPYQGLSLFVCIPAMSKTNGLRRSPRNPKEKSQFACLDFLVRTTGIEPVFSV